MVIEIVFELALAWFLHAITDAAVAGDLALVRARFVFGASVMLAGALMTYFGTYLQVSTSARVQQDLRRELYSHALRLPTRHYTKTHSGDLVSRLTNDINGIGGALGHNLVTIVQSPLVAIFAFLYLLQLNWQLAVLSGLIGPLTLLVARVFGRAMRANSAALHALLAKVNSFLTDSFTGHVVVRAFGLERALHRRYVEDTEDALRLELKGGKLRGGLNSCSHAIGSVAFIIALGVGASFVARGELTIGALIAFVQLLNRLTFPFSHLASVWAGIQSSLASAERLFALLDESPTYKELPEPPKYDQRPLTRGVSLRGVRFAYNEGAEVIDGVTFDAAAGATTALVGPSGAGKSTLFQLILGLYPPDEGVIEIDGRPVTEMEPQELYGMIAVVPQETFLFGGTIRENIAYGRPGASEDEIVEAAKSAYAHDFICELPNGYDTEIGERGVRLSGGQRQRISIARALLKNAPLLLLDEATASLDTESEVAVQAALARLMEGRTTLVIAHRLSTIHRAEKIIVLDQGRVMESGAHRDLLARNGLYARLYRLQFESDGGSPIGGLGVDPGGAV